MRDVRSRGWKKNYSPTLGVIDTRYYILFRCSSRLCIFFSWYLLAPLPYLNCQRRSPHTPPAAIPRVYTILLCVQCVYSIIRSCSYHIQVLVYPLYICIYIIICTCIYAYIIRSPLKRFLDCFFAQHKFRPKTKRQTAHGRRAENKQENIIMTGPTLPLAHADIPFLGLVTTCDALT